MPTKKQIRDYVAKLTLFHDVLFRKAAEDNKFCEEILRVMLEDNALKVISNVPQKDMTNLHGRSAILDLLCELNNGKIVNVEVQRTGEENIDHFCRVRYYSSIISTNITDPGTDYSEIPELIIIYITKNDIFKK